MLLWVTNRVVEIIHSAWLISTSVETGWRYAFPEWTGPTAWSVNYAARSASGAITTTSWPAFDENSISANPTVPVPTMIRRTEPWGAFRNA